MSRWFVVEGPRFFGNGMDYLVCRRGSDGKRHVVCCASDRETAERIALPPLLHAVRPTRLSSGLWGVMVNGTRVKTGDPVQIITRSGMSWRALVTKVVWSDGTRTVCETDSLSRRPKPPSRSPPIPPANTPAIHYCQLRRDCTTKMGVRGARGTYAPSPSSPITPPNPKPLGVSSEGREKSTLMKVLGFLPALLLFPGVPIGICVSMRWPLDMTILFTIAFLFLVGAFGVAYGGYSTNGGTENSKGLDF